MNEEEKAERKLYIKVYLKLIGDWSEVRASEQAEYAVRSMRKTFNK
jgi:hypothetical protein